jgi:site-specific recombinase XerD
MLALLDIRFSFLCRTSYKNKEGKHAIVFRVIYRDERRDIFTGLFCTREQWSSRDQRLQPAKKYATYNDALDNIERKAAHVFEQLKFSARLFTIDELVGKIKGLEEKPELLMDFLESQKETMKKRVGVDITRTTYDKYRRSASHVQDFLQTEFRIKNYPLVRIDVTFLEKYFQYLRGVRGVSHNVAVKYVIFFKTILMPAIREGLVKLEAFRQLKLRQKPVHKGYLTIEELQLLTVVPLSHELDRIRHIFLFSCYTGLAYSDIKQLSRAHINKEGEDDFYIRKPRQKTGQESIIPLLPPAIRILQQYSPTGDFRDFKWRVSSNQKMNQRLKTIGEKAGVLKELHMHLARHTFATTITLSQGVPLETVSRMLGHASLKQTQHYAKLTGGKIIEDMNRIKRLFQ